MRQKRQCRTTIQSRQSENGFSPNLVHRIVRRDGQSGANFGAVEFKLGQEHDGPVTIGQNSIARRYDQTPEIGLAE